MFKKIVLPLMLLGVGGFVVVLAVSSVFVLIGPGAATLRTVNPCAAQTLNPCAAKTLNPCLAKTLSPCAAKTINPYQAKNPCMAKNL